MTFSCSLKVQTFVIMPMITLYLHLAKRLTKYQKTSFTERLNTACKKANLNLHALNRISDLFSLIFLPMTFPYLLKVQTFVIMSMITLYLHLAKRLTKLPENFKIIS